MSKCKINLACGGGYVVGDGWLNFDYAGSSPAVQTVDLLSRMLLASNKAALVYSSHFLEHIPRNQVPCFLSERWRILQPGGVLRLVVPDSENLYRTNLGHRDRGEHAQADLVVLLLLNQCVHRESGVELGCFYHQLRMAPEANSEAMAFVRHRTGEDLISPPARPKAALGPAVQKGRSQCGAPLDPGGAAVVAKGFSQPECDSDCRGRAPSLALRSRSAPADTCRRRFCGHRSLQCSHQPRGRLSLSAARPGFRWPTAQVSRVAFYRSTEARLNRWLKPVVGAFLEGGQHG